MWECKVLHLGTSNLSWEYHMNGTTLEETSDENILESQLTGT